MFPAAVRQIATSQAERCNCIIFKERLEVIPDVPPEHLGRLPVGLNGSIRKDKSEQRRARSAGGGSGAGGDSGGDARELLPGSCHGRAGEMPNTYRYKM